MAQAAVAGIDPRAFLHSRDDIELAALIEIAKQAMEIQSEHRRDLAERIIQRLHKALTHNG